MGLGKTPHFHRSLDTGANLRAAPRRGGLYRVDHNGPQVELEYEFLVSW